MDLIYEGSKYIRRRPWPWRGAAFREEGRRLAAQLHSYAIDLSYNKATEFSPDIAESTVMAAKVALIALGCDSNEFKDYERHALYYKAFERTKPLVEDYERFKASVIGTPN